MPVGGTTCYLSSRWCRFPVGVDAPPDPPASLDALIAWAARIPRLRVRWSRSLPDARAIYVWDTRIREGAICVPHGAAARPSLGKVRLLHEVWHHFTMLITAIPGPSVQDVMSHRNEACAQRGVAPALIPWQAAVSGATTVELAETFDVPADVAELALRLAKEGCIACMDQEREVPPNCPYRRDAIPSMAMSVSNS